MSEIRKLAEGWEWKFGKTPKFSTNRTFTSDKLGTELSVICNFEKGRIHEAEIACDCSIPRVKEYTDILRRELLGQRLCREDLNQVLQVHDLSPLVKQEELVIEWINQCCVQALCTGV